MSQRLYALLVGINNYPNPSHCLGGCISDMEGWKSYLATYSQKVGYKFHPLILRDDAATRQAIIEGFTEHLTQAQQGDLAVFFFAGHGSQIPGQKVFNQMPHEKNQTLVCWDSRSGSWDLVDKELSNLVADVAIHQPQITLILDCCHSGSASRDEFLKGQDKEFKKRQIEPQSVMERPRNSYFSSAKTPVFGQAHNQKRANRTANARDDIFQLRQGRHILFSACHEVETAKEIRMEEGFPRGVFSYYLQQILAEATREMTYAELLAQARYELKKQNISAQVPQLEVIKGDDADFQRFFLSQEIQADSDGLFTLSYDEEWRVDGGHVHGWENAEVEDGIELSIFSFADEPEKIKKGLGQLTTARIEEVHSTFSRVRVDKPQALDKHQLYKALITKASISSMLTVFLEGHQTGIETLRRSLLGMDKCLVDAQEVNDASQAMVTLKAKDSEYEIFRGAALGESMSVPVAVREYHPDIPTDLVEPLMRIRRWLDLRYLANTKLDDTLSSRVEFQLILNQKLCEGSELKRTCEYKDGRWLIPDVQFQMINRTSSSIYCAVLYLSPEFGIDPNLIEAGELKVEPSEVGKSIKFSLAVPKVFVEQGITEYPACFKLIASNKPFNARVWRQPGLEKLHREIIPQQEDRELWLTKEIVVSCSIPKEEIAVPDSQADLIADSSQMQETGKAMEIKELWLMDESNLLIHLGQLVERSPVVTERPIEMGQAEILERSPVVTERPLTGESILIPSEEKNLAAEQNFLKKGDQFFNKVSPKIDELLLSSGGSVRDSDLGHELPHLITQKNDDSTIQAIEILKALLMRTFNMSQDVSITVATLTLKKVSADTFNLMLKDLKTDMSKSTPSNQTNTDSVSFQNEIHGGQVNQGQNLTINNDFLNSFSSESPVKSDNQSTILFLAANPETTSRLRLDKEFRGISESLRRAQKRDSFNLQNRGAVRPRDFYEAILDSTPQIIHFSGHGSGEEGIALEDNQGRVALMSMKKLDTLFELFAEEEVKCVLLNACYSEAQAEVIHKHIPYVIGMSRSISDKAAIEFSVAFYGAIGAGRDIEFAFKLARAQLIDSDERDIPQILKYRA